MSYLYDAISKPNFYSFDFLHPAFYFSGRSLNSSLCQAADRVMPNCPSQYVSMTIIPPREIGATVILMISNVSLRTKKAAPSRPDQPDCSDMPGAPTLADARHNMVVMTTAYNNMGMVRPPRSPAEVR
jgi:hypothetical protein